jgi:hypothetical protein
MKNLVYNIDGTPVTNRMSWYKKLTGFPEEYFTL